MCILPPVEFLIDKVPPEDELDYWSLSWLAANSNYAITPGSIALGGGEALLSGGNLKLIEQISDHYADYKRNLITRSQYDYMRRKSLDLFKSNVGPFERWMFNGKTTHETIRIARGGGVPANANIAKQATRLNQLAKLGKAGGFVLTGVGVAASCVQIGNTKTSQEKNEILVESVSSTAVGLVGGALVGLFLVSNPVGWGTALVLAAGSAAASYGAGKAARYAYDTAGNKVDFVTGLGVDKVCR